MRLAYFLFSSQGRLKQPGILRYQSRSEKNVLFIFFLAMVAKEKENPSNALYVDEVLSAIENLSLFLIDTFHSLFITWTFTNKFENE